MRDLLVGAVCTTLGSVAGFLVGTSDQQAALAAWATGVESRYAGDMFCYAPRDKAGAVRANYRQQLEARRDDTVVWKREYALVSARQAALAEGAGQPGLWGEAIAACQQSGAKTCTEERLKQELAVLCPGRKTP